jgi:hypothetical protein
MRSGGPGEASPTAPARALARHGWDSGTGKAGQQPSAGNSQVRKLAGSNSILPLWGTTLSTTTGAAISPAG